MRAHDEEHGMTFDLTTQEDLLESSKFALVILDILQSYTSVNNGHSIVHEPNGL